MTSIRFDFDLAAVERALDSVERAELTAKDWGIIGQAAVVAILERTEHGLNAYGLPFARYAPSTARARVKGGRRVSAVTLAYTGQMLGALTSSPLQDGVRLSFVNQAAEQLAQLHVKGTRHMPARNFLAIMPRTKTENQLAELAARLIARRLLATVGADK